jgi:hypothetical protein
MTTAAPSRTPTLAELIRNSFDFYLEDVHTCLPGRVEKYDPAEQRADVQPMIQRRLVAEDGQEILESLPQIPEVPVAFPRSGEFFVSFPIKQDDLGILVFSERSMELYLEGQADKAGGDDPVDYRKHDLTDAFFLPGGYPWKKSLVDAHADNLVVGKDGGLQTHYKSSEIALGEENPIEKVLLGTVFRANQATLDTALNTGWTALATGWTALATVFGVLAADPAHAAVQTPLLTAQTACTAAATAATTTATAVNTFETAASANQDFQSNVVKVKK